MKNNIIAEDKVVLESFHYGDLDVVKDATITTNTDTGTRHVTLYYHFKDGETASSALIILSDKEFGKVATGMGYEKKGDR